MTPTLPDLLSDVRSGLEITAERLDGFQALVAELVRRAGAEREAETVERAQAIDALVQRLTRLATVAQALAAAAPDAHVVLSATTLRILGELAAGDTPEGQDCDFF
jgi:hypothetical protein